MFNYRAVSFLFVVTLIGFGLTKQHVAAETTSDNKTCQLVIGWHHWPPFQYLDDNNQPVGFQIQLAKRLASMVNCEAKFLLQTFEQNQQSIRNGEIDLVFDIRPTKQRKQYGYFSIPYRREMYVLYVWPEAYERCRASTLSELIESGFRLMLNDGVIYGEDILAIQNDEKLSHLIQYESSNARLLNLFINKEIDGIVEDPIVMAFSKRSEEKLQETRSCYISVNTELVSIMFSQMTTHPELVNKFNKAIEQLKNEPGYLRVWGI